MLSADRGAGVERGIWILEDHLYVAPERPSASLALERVGNVVAIEDDRASRGRVEQANEHATERRFATAALPYQAKRLTLGDVEERRPWPPPPPVRWSRRMEDSAPSPGSP